MTAREVKIMVDRVLGAVSLFYQGGSLRLILPKSAVRALGTKIDGHGEDDDKSTFVVIATNKGLILRSLQDYLDDDEMKLTNPS